MSRHDRELVYVADVYESSPRDSYRSLVSGEEAIAELRAAAGTQLDPDFVEAMAKVAHRHDRALGRRRDGVDNERKR